MLSVGSEKSTAILLLAELATARSGLFPQHATATSAATRPVDSYTPPTDATAQTAARPTLGGALAPVEVSYLQRLVRRMETQGIRDELNRKAWDLPERTTPISRESTSICLGKDGSVFITWTSHHLTKEKALSQYATGTYHIDLDANRIDLKLQPVYKYWSPENFKSKTLKQIAAQIEAAAPVKAPASFKFNVGTAGELTIEGLT